MSSQNSTPRASGGPESASTGRPLDACTIVSKNYLPFARVLARSFLEHNPAGRFFVLLYDRNDDYIDVEAEPFELIEVGDLDIPDLRGFLFKYTVLEGNTAAKPYFLEFLFEERDSERLLYLDPDIWVMQPLEELDQLLREHLVVLTPHLDTPIEDDAHPGEQSILQSGTYNLGFVGLRRDPETFRLLRWWQERLWDKCVVAIPEGLFVDQKWMDLSPGLFAGVHVVRDPGYNVAYWNLHGRRITIDEGVAHANGRPLHFFHFSGIDPNALQRVSKHQDRFNLNQIGAAADLYRAYSKRLLEEGYDECKSWPFAFAKFDSQVRVPAVARRLFLNLPPQERAQYGDPFDASSEPSFFSWLQASNDGKRQLSRVLAHTWMQREDLHTQFPDPAGASWPDYSSWLKDCGESELGLDPPFLENLYTESPATWFTPTGFVKKCRGLLRRAWRSEIAKSQRRWLKRRMGAQRFEAMKRRLRPQKFTAPAAPIGASAVGRAPVGEPGINLIGYFSAETGMGEAARGLARALATTGISHSLHNLELGVVARRQGDVMGAETLEPGSVDLKHNINLMVVNADQVPPVFEYLGTEALGDKLNVGYWLWEMETFPDRYRESFAPLHEVWTSSSFCADAISAAAPVPVRRLPIPVQMPDNFDAADPAHRDRFDIAQNTFVVLYMFNFLSHTERKNPLALVRAFKSAFGASEDALLVLKTSQADFAEQEYQELLAAAGSANVRVVDEYLERDEVWSLMAAADVYASPHRSEGYGLTLAESMALERPAIGAAYSGVADFFNLNNGYPVRYSLQMLEEDSGPYPAGARWAEIDEEHLAQRLGEARSDAETLRRLGVAARRQVETELSFAAVGKRLERLFEAVSTDAG